MHFGASPEKSAASFPAAPSAAGVGGSGGGGSNGKRFQNGDATATTAAAAAGSAASNGSGGGNGKTPSAQRSAADSPPAADPSVWRWTGVSRGEVDGGGPAASRGGPGALPAARGASATNQERLAAERAFSSMDQNSGRVSTPRFEELLTLLGTPEASRKGDATESARSVGLLSAYSFTKADFIAW